MPMPRRHCEFERPGWPGDETRQGPEEQGLDASHRPRPFKRALKVTVLEDELGATNIGRLASCALEGRKDRCRPTLTSSAGVVILIGSSSRQGA